MDEMRKPLQGIWNIIRFNWHFYLIAFILIVLLFYIQNYFSSAARFCVDVLLISGISSIFISLLVSAYIYDFSGFYNLKWLNHLIHPEPEKIININAGFDETSNLLKNKYRKAEIKVYDFYNREKHTEISISRARIAFQPYPGTLMINTSEIPLENNSADNIFCILTAHEIRNREERNSFFRELYRVLSPEGHLIITEHLLDVPNLLAYTIGAFHFHTKVTWLKAFRSANFHIKHRIKVNPFITTFILTKNGIAS